MENASKALIMAGGILIAIMVIGVALFILNGARGFAGTMNDQAEISARESFNRYYMSFGDSGSTITGLDVLNIYNKAQDDTLRTDSVHAVTINVSSALIEALNAPTGYEMMSRTYTYTYSYDFAGYINAITIQ